MHCNEFRNNLTSYLENELSIEEKKATLAHEEGCVDCSRLKKEYQEVISNLSRLSKIKTSQNFEKILAQKLQDLPGESLIGKIREMLIPSSIGGRTLAVGFAALVLVLTGSYLFYNSSFSESGDAMPALSSPSFIEKKVVDSSSEIIDDEEKMNSTESEDTDDDEEINSIEAESTKK